MPSPIASPRPEIHDGEVDRVVFYEKPFLKFERLLETYLAFAPRGFASFRKAMPLWIGEKLFQRDLLLGELAAIAPALGDKARLRFCEHHFRTPHRRIFRRRLQRRRC